MAGLNFGAGIDTTQFSKDVEKMRRDIMSITKEGEKVNLGGLKDQISIQKNAIKELENQYKEAQKQIEQVPPGTARQKIIAEHKQIGVAIEEEKQALDVLTKTYQSFEREQQSVRSRQREIRHELYAMAQAGEENSQKFQELVAELEKLDSSVDSVKSLQNAMRGGSPAMEAFTGSLRVGTGAFTAFTGAMGLFNDQNERFEELQTRLQSVMAISIGVEQTYQALMKEGRLIQSIRALQIRATTKAQQLQTRTTVSATVAQRAFNAVAKANPYVLLAGAIISVVGALALFTRRNNEARKAQEELNKAVFESTSSDITQFSLLQEQWKRAGDNLDLQKEAMKDFNQALGERTGFLNDIDSAEKVLTGSTDTFIKAMEKRAEAEYLVAKSSELWEKYRREQQKVKDFDDEWANSSNWEKIKLSASTMWKSITGQDVVDSGAMDEARIKYQDNLTKIQEAQEEARKAFKSLGLEDSEEEEQEITKQTQTIEQRLNERKSIWEDYYKAVRLIGEEQAKKIYGDEIDVDSSFVEELRKQRNELHELDNPTKQQVQNLIRLNEIINELTGKESYFEKEKRNVFEYAESIDNASERIAYLRSIQSNLGESFEELEFSNEISKAIEKEKQSIEDLYNSFKDKFEESEKERANIIIKYQQIINEAIKRRDEEVAENAKNEMEKKLNEIDVGDFLGSQALIDLFRNLEYQSSSALERVRKELELLAKTSKDLDPASVNAILDKIKEIERVQASRNPFKALVDGIEDLKDASDDLDKAYDNYEKAVSEFGKTSKEAVKAENDLIDAENEHAQSLMRLSEGITATTELMSGSINQIINMANELGGLSDSLNQTLNDISNAFESAGEFFKGYSTGDVGSMISGAFGFITSIGSIFESIFSRSNSWEKVIKRIEVAFEKLERKINNAVGTQAMQLRVEQLALLEKGIKDIINLPDGIDLLNVDFDEEFKNLPGVFEKIKNALIEMQSEMREVFKGIQNEILGLDTESMADNLASALIQAAQEGESAFQAMQRSIEDIMNQIVQNAIAMRIAEALNPIIDDFINNIIDRADETGEFSVIPDEVAELMDDILRASQGWEEFLEQWEDLLGIDQTSEANSLSGAIKGVSEETAGIIAGQMEAIRVYQAQGINIFEGVQSAIIEGNSYLLQIRDNTNALNLISLNISEMNDKMEENLAGL